MSKNYCAKLVNNVVMEIIVSEYQWAVDNLSGDWHDLGPEPLTVAIGWFYDAESQTFSPPPPKPLLEQ